MITVFASGDAVRQRSRSFANAIPIHQRSTFIVKLVLDRSFAKEVFCWFLCIRVVVAAIRTLRS